MVKGLMIGVARYVVEHTIIPLAESQERKHARRAREARQENERLKRLNQSIYEAKFGRVRAY